MSRNEKNKQKQSSLNKPSSKWDRRYLLLIPSLLCFALYAPVLQYGFVPNWDDGGYIINNPVIQSLTKANFVEIFTSFYKGNYHPLTTLVYAFTWAIAGNEPFLYHLLNILLHIANLVLVYALIKRLLHNEMMAFWSAMIFGLHPMHIESVAWISELKDVMYGFFYLLSLLAYLRFSSGKNKKRTLFYFLSLLFFILSLASKSAAVTLSVLLFLIDWISRRKYSWRTIAEKIPFLTLSIIFGIIAMMSQSKQGAIQDLTPLYTGVERMFIVSYAIMVYVLKFLAPFSLSAMYPYPSNLDGHLPFEVYAALPIVLILIGLLVFSLRKTRTPFFGGLFFLITAALTLQVIPVGGAIVAERYTYLPYIGLGIIPLYYLCSVNPIPGSRWTWQNIILLAFSVFLMIISFIRIPVWKDGIHLFSDVIEKHPNLPFAYNNRGYAYQTYYNDNEKAFQDYNRAIAIDSTYHQSLSNRAVLYHNRGQYEEAIVDFSRSLRYNPQNTDALIGRANTLSMLQKYQEAIPDYNAYLDLMPGHAQAWLWRAVAYYQIEQYDAALQDFETCLLLEPRNDEAIYWKGMLRYLQGDNTGALALLSQSLQLNANRTQAWVWKGIIYQKLRAYNEAIEAYSNALSLSPNDYSAYYNRAICYADQQDFIRSLADLEKAMALGYPVNPAFLGEIRHRSALQAKAR